MRIRQLEVHAYALALVMACGAPIGIAAAQQASASAAAYGMGNNFTAKARGFNAVAWNPANLGLAGNPGFSISLLGVNGTSGLDPVDASAFNKYAGHKVLDPAVKADWLNQVTNKQGETGNADGGVSWVAFNAGRLGFQISSSAYGAAKMNPDAVEALLYGNAGKTGVARDLNFAGSNFRAGSFTTVAASYGMGLSSDAKTRQSFALGATVKYVVGHVMTIAGDNSSSSTAPNVQLNFPIIHTNFERDDAKDSGSGFGADVGFAGTMNGWTYGGTIQNVFNSFEWNDAHLRYRPGTATFDGNTGKANFDTASLASAPASLRQRVKDNKFKPTVVLGVARQWTKTLNITVDARQQFTDTNSVVIGPKTQVGVGAEFNGLSRLPLRGGVSYVTGGVAFSAGIGVRLLSWELDVAGMVRNRDVGKETGLMLTILSIH